MIVGATGIGKTQLGVQFADAGRRQEGFRGVLFDVSSRGDSQSHADYAERICGWQLQPDGPATDADAVFGGTMLSDYLHVFEYHGRRVTRNDLEFDEWHEWQAEMNAKLRHAIAFLYGNFVRGVRRVVVDGVEPVDRPQDSIQFQMFEYIYHQVVRKDPEWVARDLFRETYRQHAVAAAEHRYDPSQIGCLLLYTSHETMLDDLVSRRLDEGDVLSNANTLIYMGKIREGRRILRGLYVAKHRGSACSEQITPYHIDDDGIHFD